MNPPDSPSDLDGVVETQVTEAIARRQDEIIAALQGLPDDTLWAPATLPGWDRLTVVCHLRYGAEASARMTPAMLSGEPTAYYPEGRETHRPRTLAPQPGETPAGAVSSLATACHNLMRAWSDLTHSQWATTLVEPAGQADLGSITLARLAILRLTEVEVHGSDLDLGLIPWSDTFVSLALPQRLAMLPARRSNHKAWEAVTASWKLDATDGPSYLVVADGPQVEITSNPPAGLTKTVLSGTSAELLGFMLGRLSPHEVAVAGDARGAERFMAAFPSP